MQSQRGWADPAHANAGLTLGDQDGVGLDALADLPGKLELGHLGVGGLAVGGERKGRRILGHVVDLLHQHAAVDGAQLHLAPWSTPPVASTRRLGRLAMRSSASAV